MDRDDDLLAPIELREQGSLALLKLTALLAPDVRRLRKQLWGHTQPLASPHRKYEDPETEEAFEPVWAWLEDSPVIGWDVFAKGDRWIRTLVLARPSLSRPDPPPGLTNEVEYAPGSGPLDTVNEWPTPCTQAALDLCNAVAELMGAVPAPAWLKDWVIESDLATHLVSGLPLTPPVARAGAGFHIRVDLRMRFDHITLDVFDPAAVTPEQVAELYRKAREIRTRRIDKKTEELAMLELELIVAEARRRAEAGEVIDPDEWEWRPSPTVLMKAWNNRMELLGDSEAVIRSRSVVGEFQKRTPLWLYKPALSPPL